MEHWERQFDRAVNIEYVLEESLSKRLLFIVVLYSDFSCPFSSVTEPKFKHVRMQRILSNVSEYRANL